MHIQLVSAFIVYFSVLIGVGLFASKKQTSSEDFLLGGRGLNYWVAAVSANASDMSVWLFMALPGAIYASGLIQAWTACALAVFMFLNWHLIAPRLRRETERYGALTLSSYFEKRLDDTSGKIRLVSAMIALVFMTTYVASGMVGLGILFESLFGFDYYVGCLIGVGAMGVYTLVGGFHAIAWTDFFQGMFLLLVVTYVPFLAFGQVGGWQGVWEAAQNRQISFSLLPTEDSVGWIEVFSMTVGWGFGYFGQPHILNKFMAIKNAEEVYKSKYVSTVWQVLALSGSVCIGLVAIAYFPTELANSELAFVEMVKAMFGPFLSGIILCAMLAATLSTMDSQIIVLASVLSEDIYKKTLNPKASQSQVLWVSRASVLAVSIIGLEIAYTRPASIFDLVSYCWIGLGCTFGPLLVSSLYMKRITHQGGLAGLIVGGAIGAFWSMTGSSLSAMLPGFFGSLLAIWAVSLSTQPKTE